MRMVIAVIVMVVALGVHASDEGTLAQAERDGVVLASGAGTTCGLRSDGTVFCFGVGWPFQKEGSQLASRFKSIQSGFWKPCGITLEGSVACLGGGLQSVSSFPDAGKLKSISAGMFHSCAITEEGAVLCVGTDFVNSLKSPIPSDRFISISSGAAHTCGIKEDKTVSCFGEGAEDYQIMFPKEVKFKSISSGANHTCGLKENGSLLCFGREVGKVAIETPLDIKFRSIASGTFHVCGIREDGRLHCFGDALKDQRKDFPHGVKFKSISAGGDSTCGVTDDGKLLCFGNDQWSQRTGMPSDDFSTYPVLAFESLHEGLMNLSRYVYPEKVGFIESIAAIADTLPPPVAEDPFSSLGFELASARLLAFNYLEPFLADIETEVMESKVLPRYRTELEKWNALAEVITTSDIAFSDQSYSVSLSYLVVALTACAPLESEGDESAELTALITSLGEIKASGEMRVGDVLDQLDNHAELINRLTESPATKGFAGVIHKVRGYLAAQVRESR